MVIANINVQVDAGQKIGIGDRCIGKCLIDLCQRYSRRQMGVLRFRQTPPVRMVWPVVYM